MSNHQLMRLIETILRNRRGKTRQLVLLLAALVLVYTFLRPVVEDRYGVSLPGLGGTEKGALPRESASRSSENTDAGQVHDDAGAPDGAAIASGEKVILDAYAARKSNIIVTVDAVIRKKLPDDNVGSRHQKMILEFPSGHTVLLAHNIDLSKRVPAQTGDTIRVKGEYEYSEQGGVLHWTHHDPGGRHEDGWIEYRGRRYE
jgi:hypothetical protein